MQDLFNEWHAKNTSDKVRKVMQSKPISSVLFTAKTLMYAPPTTFVRKSCSSLCLKVCKGYCGMCKVTKSYSHKGQLAEFGEKQKKELTEKRRELDKAKQVTRLEALTPEVVHEFIEKIVVYAPEYKDGMRYQEVAIHYNGVGIIREPTAEEMEEYFQEHISKKPFLKAKTA